MMTIQSEKFHCMTATVDTVVLDDGRTVKRLLSYDSIVCDLDLYTCTVYLYPRYQYSTTTTRRVTRFLDEYMPLADGRWSIGLIHAISGGYRAICKCPGIFKDYRVVFPDYVMGTMCRW